MTSHEPIRPPQAPHAFEPLSTTEEIEEVASETTLAAGVAVRTVEVAAAVFLALLVCPPLFILAVVVVVPLAAMALVVALIAAILAAPYVLVRHLRGHRGGHASLFLQRLRHAGRALLDLWPHRIVADVRKMHHGR